jgi:hypothetical protein
LNPGQRRRVELKGGLEKTGSSAEIQGDGSLVVELYDFSPEAERWFGNDVAFLLKVSAPDKEQMLARLQAGQPPLPDASDRADLLLRLIAERFSDYFAVKQWLEENAIPYQKEFDSWA